VNRMSSRNWRLLLYGLVGVGAAVVVARSLGCKSRWRSEDPSSHAEKLVRQAQSTISEIQENLEAFRRALSAAVPPKEA
jgi:hypothetical protein